MRFKFLFFIVSWFLTSFAHAEDVGITLPGFTTLFSAITTLIGSLVGILAVVLGYKKIMSLLNSDTDTGQDFSELYEDD